MRWRIAKMSWSPGSPPESAGKPQRCLFQRDFACPVLYKQADADRLQREFGKGFVPLMMDITDAEALPSFFPARNNPIVQLVCNRREENR